MDAGGGYTKYGENRIKNCRKYDLGCGYRLITLRRRERVFVPFLGTHDACQRWLENNSRLKTPSAGNGTLVEILPETAAPKSPKAGDRLYFGDDALPMRFSDPELRCVFSGLVKGRANQPEGIEMETIHER